MKLVLSSLILFLILLIHGHALSQTATTQNEQEPHQLTEKTADVLRASDDLQESWRATLEKNAKRFDTQLHNVNEIVAQLEHALDHGNQDLRNAINENLNDLRREQDDLQRIFDEITASQAIKMINIPGDVQDAWEDLQD